MTDTASVWKDISIALREGMILWPEDPAIEIRTTQLPAYQLTSLRMSAHAGTHMDAPRHFFPSGVSIDQIPPGVCVGVARVVACDGPVTVAALAEVGRGERILFKTRNSRRRWMELPFDGGFDAITPEAAVELAERGTLLVGIDAMSVDVADSADFPVHKTLLGAGVWIVEALDLCDTSAGLYDLACVPLRVEASDGAPARALIRAR